MIQRLEWDSALFNRAIGVLECAAASVEAEVAAAVRDGYAYLICKPAMDDAPLMRALGQARFYVSDQGVTWATPTRAFQPVTASASTPVVEAGTADIPALQRMIRGMFLDSRFYNDPFYSFEEADLLHAEWISNSVKRTAADGVLWIPSGGFVTMKRRPSGGEVVLIGVDTAQRRRGVGRALLTAAMRWFGQAGVELVTVRTQLRNIRASRFYQAHGFTFHAADITFSRMLTSSDKA